MSKEQENKIEMMMVQLLFKNKPQSPSSGQLKTALEKYLGDLGEVPYELLNMVHLMNLSDKMEYTEICWINSKNLLNGRCNNGGKTEIVNIT